MFVGPTLVQVLSEFVHLFQSVAEDHVVTLELKVSNKFLLLEYQGEPQNIVSPHFAEGNLVTLEPPRPHLYKNEKRKKQF